MRAAGRAPGARLVSRAAATAAVCLIGLLSLALPASASGNESVVSYHEKITLDGAGRATVALDLAMDFGDNGRHGPFLHVITRQGYSDTQDREYLVSDVTASSPDAPASVQVTDVGSEVEIRVGEASTTISGVHHYRIGYVVDGWVNPAGFAFASGTLDHDELYLNATGDQWDMPLNDVSVTVVGPAPVTKATCFAGAQDSTSPCDHVPAPGPSVTYTQGALQPGEQLTVVAAFPAGTFTTTPTLVDASRATSAERNPFAPNPWNLGITGLVALLGSAFTIRRARQQGRDEAYLGLTPGLSPVAGADGAVGARQKASVTVRFTPPDGLHPGQLGTLIDETADTRDVTSTIVDLAVRGYLLIEQLTEPEKDWRLVWTGKDPSGLLPYEEVLASQLFRGAQQTTLSELRTTFSSDLKRIQGLLYEDVTGRGWFRSNPQTARGRWAGRGIVLIVVGGILMGALAQATSFAPVGLGVIAVGLVTLVTTRMAPARTAAGSAVLAQTQGFRLYLATAEADQLRFEEGEDLFSRYLPYAIAFDLTQRWARVFAEMAARGADLPTPTWYVGSWGYAGFWASAGSLDRDLAGFTSAADSAVSAPTPGSSGSSGFGGGGFSGGGGGGGGGGSW